MKTCYDVTIADYPIRLVQVNSDCFDVVYGLDVNKGLNYQQAATALGECIMHALACEGKLDNE